MKLRLMKMILTSISILTVTLLASCGGGGSDGDDGSTDNQTDAVWGQTNWDESSWQ